MQIRVASAEIVEPQNIQLLAQGADQRVIHAVMQVGKRLRQRQA